jgi:uncharacterized protein (AIM24 family)
MKYRIVGDHHQLIAIDLKAGERLLVFGGDYVFSKGNIELADTGQDSSISGLPVPMQLSCSGGQGLVGVIPKTGGHLKRVEIDPVSGLVVASASLFILSHGVTPSPYKSPLEISALLEKAKLVKLNGVGMAIVRTDENFVEFTLGTEDELRANVHHVVAFSGGTKVKPGQVTSGEDTVTFAGPGAVTLGSR